MPAKQTHITLFTLTSTALISLLIGCGHKANQTSLVCDKAGPRPTNAQQGSHEDPETVQEQTERKELLQKARMWINQCLVPTEDEHPAYWRLGRRSRERYGFVVCYQFRLGVIDFFVRVGPDIIPDLIPLVHDHRSTPWSFQVIRYPLSSIGIRAGEGGMTVSAVACYLIEAILRENPFFAHEALIEGIHLDALGGFPEGKAALERMAKAYDDWFARCYDPATRTFTCDEDDLPEVSWNYALSWWSEFQRVFPEHVERSIGDPKVPLDWDKWERLRDEVLDQAQARREEVLRRKALKDGA